jgi:PAS domain-containing protein
VKGETVGAVVTFMDITQRKNLERMVYLEKEQFRTTLLSVGDGVISTDASGRIEVMNSVAEELVVASTGDNSYAFHYIESSKSPEYPLGFYLFHRKQTDGSWSSDFRGRAVVYLGENQEEWRSPAPQE